MLERKESQPQFDPKQYAIGIVAGLQTRRTDQSPVRYLIDSLRAVPQDEEAFVRTVMYVHHQTFLPDDPSWEIPDDFKNTIEKMRLKEKRTIPDEEENPEIVALEKQHDEFETNINYSEKFLQYEILLGRRKWNQDKKDWQEIPEEPNLTDEENVTRVGFHLFSLRSTLATIKEIEEEAKATASGVTPRQDFSVENTINNAMTGYNHTISIAHENQINNRTAAMLALREGEWQPLLETLREDIEVIGKTHPNVLIDAFNIPGVLREKEKEKVEKARDSYSDIKQLTDEFDEFNDPKSPEFRAWVDRVSHDRTHNKNFTTQNIDRNRMRDILLEEDYPIIIDASNLSGKLSSVHNKIDQTVLVMLYGKRVTPTS